MLKNKMRWILCAAALLAGLFLSGCVSEIVEPDHTPRLGVSQTSDGMISLQLETEVGYKYTILYMDPKEGRWKPLKGCESIRGTGEVVEIQKKIRRNQSVPDFTVDFAKISQ